MTQPKISIIIPLYNTEDYIKETLCSIINQTFKEIEIIIINDGSTDNSLAIINEVSLSDPRIKIFTQKNQGLSVTRNNGYDIAKGEYIYFMDSDDLLSEDTLERCYDKCKKENLDFLFFNASVFGDTNEAFPPNNYIRTIPENRVYSGIEAMNTLMDNYEFRSSVCLNFIKRDYLEQIELRHFPNIIHEDELFTTLLYLQAERVGFIKESFFKRRVRPNSTMTIKTKYRNIECYFIVADEIIEFAKGKDKKTQQTIDRFLKNLISAVLYKSTKLPLGDKVKIGTKTVKDYRRYLKLKMLLILFVK